MGKKRKDQPDVQSKEEKLYAVPLEASSGEALEELSSDELEDAHGGLQAISNINKSLIGRRPKPDLNLNTVYGGVGNDDLPFKPGGRGGL